MPTDATPEAVRQQTEQTDQLLRDISWRLYSLSAEETARLYEQKDRLMTELDAVVGLLVATPTTSW